DPGSLPARPAIQMIQKSNPTRIDPVSTRQEQEILTQRLDESWSLADAEISIRAIEQPQTATGGEYIAPCVELSTERIFLSDSIVDAALRSRTNLLTDHPAFATDSEQDLRFSQMVTNGVRVLTYLANLIQAGDRTVP